MSKKPKKLNLEVFSRDVELIYGGHTELSRPVAQIGFDEWWAVNSSKLPASLKKIVKTHFEKRGFLETKKFDEGLKDFGL